nr:hypothetical protein [Tanacetum cinerariifolium]
DRPRPAGHHLPPRPGAAGRRCRPHSRAAGRPGPQPGFGRCPESGLEARRHHPGARPGWPARQLLRRALPRGRAGARLVARAGGHHGAQPRGPCAAGHYRRPVADPRRG